MINTENLTDIEKRAIEARREYHRKWRAANKDKVRENNRRYWERVVAKMEKESEKNE